MRDTHRYDQALKPGNASFAAIVGAALLVVAVASFVQLGFEQRHKNRLEEILVGYLEKAQNEIRLWQEIRKNDASGLVQAYPFEAYLDRLEPLENNPDALKTSDAQKDLRQRLSNATLSRGYEGYFIISRNRMNLASMRDANIGLKSLLAGQDEFFDTLDRGEPAVSQIVRSEVPLPDSLGNFVTGLPTAFAGAPIRTAGDKVRGYFIVRIPVSRNLTAVLRNSQYGLSGETFAFDGNGAVTSRSKFQSEMAARGPLQLGPVSAGMLRLKEATVDAGKNRGTRSEGDELPLARMAQVAATGGSGTDLEGYRDYRGVEVVGAWKWVDHLGFGIATELDKDEAFSAYYIAAWAVWGVALGAFLLFLIHTWITQRSAQQAVFREEKLRAIMGSSVDGIIVIDSRSRIEMINPAGAAIFGYQSDELTGEDVAVLIPSEDRSRHRQLVANSRMKVSTDIRRDGGRYGQHRDGRTVPIELDVSPLELGDEKLFVGVVRDITARLEADAERHKREQLLATILQTSGAGVLFLDADARITFANDTFERWSLQGGGPSAKLWIGESYRETIARTVSEEDSDPAEFIRTLDEIIKGERSTAESVYAFTGTSKKKWSKTYFWHIAGDYDVRCVVMHLDVTEMYLAEEKARLASEEAAAANNAKSLFLATMSHEIRTPMNSIIGLVDLLRDTAGNEEQQSMLQTVGDSAQSLLMIINDILDLSKIDSDSFNIESIPVNLMEMLESVGELFSASANQSGVDILIDTPLDVPGWYYGDPTRLRQIIINLVGNAIKFSRSTDRKGRVILSTRIVSSDDGADRIEVAVQDNGIGIEKDRIEELFQPFVQADSSTTRRFGGTGLGLTITSKLVAKMGGGISVDSEAGVGSRFVVELPCRPAPVPVGAPLPVDLHGVSVCLIFGDDGRAEILSRILGSVGARVRRLHDPAEMDQGFDADVVLISASWNQDQIRRQIESIVGSAKARQIWFVRLSSDFHEKKGHVGPNVAVIGCHPLKPTEVTNICAVAVGRRSRTVVWEDFEDDRSAAHLIDGPAAAHRRPWETLPMILVAEDHPSNQEVLRRQLASLGYECKVVGNGLEALRELEQSREYALLLTDCHMPVMDGFELTRIIRKAEARSDRKVEPMPIVAITANALIGDAERCIDMGMNDYLSKPVKLPQLGRTIRRWAKMPGTAEPANAEVPAGNAPCDLKQLAEIVGNEDPAFLGTLVDAYRVALEADVAAIEQAIEADDMADLKQQAHKAKGGARIAAAPHLAGLFESIEKAAMQDDPAEAKRLLAGLRTEIDRFASWHAERAKSQAA